MARKSFLLFVGVELLLVGCLIGSLMATGGNADAPHGLTEYFIYRYQTLITGVAALGAAWFTTATIWRQIAASDRQHAEQRFRAMGNELDALEGLVEYFDRLAYTAPYIIENGREIDQPPLNLTYRVSMHTSHRVSNSFADLMDRINRYNISDRTAIQLYGDPLRQSGHAANAIGLMGSIAALCDFARERVGEIRTYEPAPLK